MTRSGPTRRRVLTGAAGAAGATALQQQTASANPTPPGTARQTLTDRVATIKHRATVPEIFRAPPEIASHTDVIVIGTGFGGSVAGLRLGQAGATVAMLDRGSRWPRDPWRPIHATDQLPDGRAFWHSRSFTGPSNLPVVSDNFGGVFESVSYEHLQVWRGACVGGGSLVFTGVLLEPPKKYFEHVFGRTVSQREMHRKWYPKARRMLNATPMPDDVYQSEPFGHSRRWDRHARKAGFTPQPLDGIWDWDIVRAELEFRSRRSATIGESNYGNANGAKKDLTLSYIPRAEATGKVTVHHWHVVDRIGQDRDGRYTVEIRVVDPTGETRSAKTVTCGRLVLAAGTVGTSELLVRARHEGTLDRLDETAGEGFGTNGDGALVQFIAPSRGLSQGSPSASTILDDTGDLPTRMENWYTLGLQINAGIIGSLGMVMDPARANFEYDKATDDVLLRWPKDGNAAAKAAMERMHNRVAEANGVGVGVPVLGVPGVGVDFTAHPLGGAVIGRTTDSYGRVKGYEGLYVLDGAAVPGSAATANPSLTITALAERNVARIIADGV